jgi:hypothetical protein
MVLPLRAGAVCNGAVPFCITVSTNREERDAVAFEHRLEREPLYVCKAYMRLAPIRPLRRPFAEEPWSRHIHMRQGHRALRSFFSDNTDFIGGDTFSQSPIYAVQDMPSIRSGPAAARHSMA